MKIAVQLVIAFPNEARVLECSLEAGATVEQAIKASGICATAGAGQVGIYGKPVPLSQVLCDGDRIEIYRPLLADPKAVRRKRAQRS
jgi:hypothetical protein